jgi:Bifunctional DNA primase/polymerase, N-terminal
MSRERAGGMNDLATAAVAYARRGWFVFPLAPRGKTPITKRGMLDASCDPDLVAAWWAEENRSQTGAIVAQPARPNIGGACGPSGLFVVDLDGDSAVKSWTDVAAQHGGHPGTLVARTGKGFHFYFTGQGRSSAGRIAPHVDTRGAGGYTVLPPSIHVSGLVYRWIDPEMTPAPVPAWLLEALERSQPADSSVGERRRLPDGTPFTSYGRSAIAAISREMAATPEGKRNSTLNGLAYRCGRLSAAGQLAEQVARRDLVAAAIEAGLGPEEAEATFRSGFTAGLFRPVSLEALGRSSA